MSNNQIGRDQRDYIRFRESDSFEDKRDETNGSFTGRFRGKNRFGEERIKHDSYQDDQFRSDYDPTYEDEYGMKHPYEHGGKLNRWSDDIRSESSHENHRGKGPKGFQRSPVRIKDEACELLARDSELDASDIEVDVEDNCIVLKGEVDSRKDKRLAELLVENISGIEDVYNQLRVKKRIEGWVPGLGKVQGTKEGGHHEQ